MTLLDNELVRKYFEEGKCYQQERILCTLRGSPQHNGCLAGRILRAMQDPVRKGEKILLVLINEEIVEKIAYEDHSKLHFDILRLPDRFQKQEQKGFENYCPNCGHGFNKPTPEPEKCWRDGWTKEDHLKRLAEFPCPKDEVEAKIKHIIEGVPFFINDKSIQKDLRELVELAKKK